MKKKTTHYAGTLYMSDLDGSNLQEVIELITEKMPPNSKLDHDYGETSFNILVERDETDAEYEMRVRLEESNKKALEDREKAQLEQLLRKYGNGN